MQKEMRQNKGMPFVFEPQRLRDARIASGKTIKEVAEEIGVSSQAISMYELSRCKPKAELFLKLMKLYHLPIYFFKKPYHHLNQSQIYFRSFSATTSTKRNTSIVLSNWVCDEIYEFLKDIIRFPQVDKLFNRIRDFKNIGTFQNMEYWARFVRKAWKLDDTPISNLIRLLEEKGVIVVLLDLDTTIDGFSFWYDGRPFIFANRNNTAVRLRMSIAHELCHLLFHADRDVQKELRELELEANRFAGAFLLPENGFMKDLYSANLDTFLYLKPKWKVSLAAMLMRVRELEFIMDDRYLYLQKQISRKHWRKVEPLDDEMPIEEPVLLKQSVKMILDNNYCRERDLLDKIALPISFIEEACFIKKGTLQYDDIMVDFKASLHELKS